MKADALHGCIQKRWNKQEEVVTIHDFKQILCTTAVQKARVVEMQFSDFYQFKDFTKSKKPVTLNNLVEIGFETALELNTHNSYSWPFRPRACTPKTREGRE